MELALLAAAAALVVLLPLIHVLRRRARERRDTAALEKNVAARRNLPASLHPVIDPELCIGSLACLKACPEGDILGIIDGKARLVHADRCIGHGRCEAECPVGAITLVMGSAERGVDLPEVDEFFESSRRGVHVVGELGGMGLIRNAVAQGAQTAERLAEVLPKTPAETDVAIVGAGPAGLATASVLRAKGRTFRVLDQQTLGGTVAQYPRKKLVLTEPVHLPFLGRLSHSPLFKEELIAAWKKLVHKAKIDVEEGVKVEALNGEDGAFELLTTKGPVKARKVVLATGRRGTPRKLGVPGEQRDKVTYRLDHAEQYDEDHVLVVGGGDSAVEAACQLATESTAKVTIAYRGTEFSRCKEPNRVKIAKLAEEKKLTVLFGAEVTAIDEKHVAFNTGARIDNDAVIVLAGGELPLEFLQKMGVGVKRHHGEAPKGASRVALARERQERRERRRVSLLYASLSLLIVAWLTQNGWAYYVLPHLERLRSPLHHALRPAGSTGHLIGIIASAFMLANFLYPLRKRTDVLRGAGSIRGWLDFHVFVGFTSPAVIAFHAAFQSNNQLATGTAGALLVVVLTGIVGRFVYALVPSERGRSLDLPEVLAQLTRATDRLAPLLRTAAHRERVDELALFARAPLARGGLLQLLTSAPAETLKLRTLLRRARADLQGEAWLDVRDTALRIGRLRMQVRFFGGLKRFLGTWRMFHATLAVFLVFAMALHIGVSMYLGYVWYR